MSTVLSKEIRLQTPNGDVQVRSFCDPEEIRQYDFNYQFGAHNHYRSLYTKRESLEENAGTSDANVVLALTEFKHIIGFGILAYPDPGERWAQLGPHIMMEVKAIEVCRSWRAQKIAPGIVKMMLAHPLIEDKIVYLVGYTWTWDLTGKNMTAQQYRQILIKLFQPYGFKEYETNEPNICLKPENVLMCRIGKNISQMIKDRFKWLRFGLSPWSWNIGE
jgi:acetoin utilization protein AcuA